MPGADALPDSFRLADWSEYVELLKPAGALNELPRCRRSGSTGTYSSTMSCGTLSISSTGRVV